MKILFHGTNAIAFEQGFAALLHGAHEVQTASDGLRDAAEQRAFVDADVIIGIRLTAKMPRPERLRLYHAPAAGTDGIDRLPACIGAPVQLLRP